jgi:hypothetical protein
MRKRSRVRWPLGIAALVCVCLGAAAQPGECLTTSGKTACGYNCIGSDGEVKCSQTPAGVCSAASGVVACWDPPPVLYRVFGQRLPKAECVSTFGQTACGYACEVSSDRVQCAQTPFGVCRAREGRIVCADPPAAVMLTWRLKTPEPECISNGGNIACGYHCLAHEGVQRCAQSPEGTCSVEQGTLICWDPPPETYPVTFDPGTERACLDGYQGRTCGYRCMATLRYSACGLSAQDVCRSEPEGIVCKKPAP